MSTMANFNFSQDGATMMDIRRPRSIWRRTESNLEGDFYGSKMFDLPQNKGLRRIASTLDFFSPEFRNGGSNTMLQPASESNHSHVNNRYISDDSAYTSYHTAVSSNMRAMSRSRGIGMNSSVPSKRVPYPVPAVFFGASQQCEEPFITTQQPIARPTPKAKLNISHSDPTATTSAVNDIKFPVTTNVTDSLYALYERELRKQPPRLRKEQTEPLPKLTTQSEWPPLRHSYGLAREDRGRGRRTREEHDAAARKNFEDSLFPGGLDAFINLNLQNKAERDVINANAGGVQLRLASPAPTARAVPGPQIPVMSGKKLIEDLQEYEHIPVYIDNYNLLNYLEQDLIDPKSSQSTHDRDGRRRKGFKRGDCALQVAVSEDWAVVLSMINGPIEIVPGLNRYYVIKSNCELDVFASLKYGIWTSTDLGNQRLDKAFRDPNRRGSIYLFFSVTGSGKFCGVAEMTSAADLSAHAGCWSDKRWRGRFDVRWKIIKDVLNSDLRHFRIMNNDHKPFTNCRDTQEIFPDVGDQILRIFCNYTTSTSLLESACPAPKYSVFEEHYLN